MRLAALDAHAARLGLFCGQPLAEARAMIPALESVEADPAADARLLAEIADWTDRYTPLVALAGSDGLTLDITGCAHLFGGEAALRRDLLTRLSREGFCAAATIADTLGAAAALARFGDRGIVAGGDNGAALAPLLLAALRLPAETVAALDRVGLKTIAQIAAAPRAPLTARFGPLLLRRLDQALGREDEAITPRRPPPLLIAERRFAEPLSRGEDIFATLASLAEALSLRLEEQGVGGRTFELALFRVDGAVTRRLVRASRPARDPRLVTDLFGESLSTPEGEIDAGYGFDLVRLSVVAADRIDPAAVDFSGDAEGEADLARLVDRIGARLGLARVGRILPGDSHIPERAARILAAAHAAASAWPVADWLEDEPPSRPLRLLAVPEPLEAIAEVPDGPPRRFRWRRVQYEVTRAEGPERIAPEWWRAPPQREAEQDMAGRELAGRELAGRELAGRELAGMPPWPPGLPAPIADFSVGESGQSLVGSVLWDTGLRESASGTDAPEKAGPTDASAAVEGKSAMVTPALPEIIPFPRRPAGLPQNAGVALLDSGPSEPVPPVALVTPNDLPASRQPRALAVDLDENKKTTELSSLSWGGAGGIVLSSEGGPSEEQPQASLKGRRPNPETPESLTRDYFRLEDRSGRRLWVFREGLYGLETADPRWFVHGVLG